MKSHFFGGGSLPCVLQTEAAECGLACMAMVARFHGHDIDLSGLRRRFPSSLKGTTFEQLISMAARLDLDSRPLRLELDQLGQLAVPCILHWDLNHFVVLKKVDGKHITLHDPAHGVRRISIGAASAHFTGVALELTPRSEFTAVQERRRVSLTAISGRLRGLVPALIQVLAMSIGLEVLTLVVPFYMQWTVDQALTSADHDLLGMLAIGFLGITVFSALITAARAWAMSSLGTSLNSQWASNLFGHLMRLPMDWFEKRHVGDILSRFGSIQSIQRVLTTQFIGSMLDGAMSIVTLVVMSFYSLPLTLLIVGLFLGYAIVRIVFFSPLRRATEEQIAYAARQQSELLESVRGAMPIKLANKQEIRHTRFANATVAAMNQGMAIQRLTMQFTLSNQLIFGVGRIVLVWAAATLVLSNALSAGMLIAFIAYTDQFTLRAVGLVDKWVDFRMLRLHGERIADIALTPPERGEQDTWEGSLDGQDIEFRDVGFRYSPDEPWVLRHCSFTVVSGDSVVFTGPSGSGKTTLAKLLLGLLEPEEGDILFGGVSLRRLGHRRYREHLGAVMQDDHLFAGSLADNIAFFDERASQEAIEAAARAASVHSEIVAMPMGYNTLIGDMGSALSGGQRQRVILARALYREPTLLVLDEATSHLDIHNEKHVMDAIAHMRITRVSVAHRPETIAYADARIEINEGVATSIRHGWKGSGNTLPRMPAEHIND
ncbi:peptidase domain-containing ABC transporter [Luteibacter sp. dw_328]|uniref:peptidase domain-containing ABC transporter n=1 Tax=Luteibacter sp. dw_328 TaxID=2719796 RepID=UPI0031F31C00